MYKTIDMVLEGGGIEVDEQGNLLTTVNYLLNNNRNPTMNKAAIEQTLKSELGVRNILWLTIGALEGEDTDSHIGALARFAPTHVLFFKDATINMITILMRIT